MDQDAYAGEQDSLPSVSVFPQAFLHTMGHIQYNAILPHFASFISDIRHATSHRPHTINLDDDQPLPDEYNLFGDAVDGINGVPPVVIPSAYQFYNEISHRIRPSTALHDVQQGCITSALAGTYGNATTKITRNARYSIQECHCIVIALVALHSYIADVKTLVATAIKKECLSNGKDMDLDHPGPGRDKEWLKSLQKWLACKHPHPLGYKDKAYKHLLHCIMADPNNFLDSLFNPSKEKLSIQDLTTYICTMTHIELPSSFAAPLILMASSTTVIHIAC
ncbi:hypothetical protein C8R48DRAFT_768091 [Suillus tomentosus]|nr:hypothetical protein C8R48DRAFT_768091 [Suillus tomentosus]